ncbi:hypothetical protein [Anaerovibrio sp. RM50]|uniref:hypothetical protein n=1 Tax=Anaerovibrio sp. RM50 TaxID=1200557 RepID=UPI000480DAF1|nr:hypothetical protein [Anaerovibrio sp. RM50]
MKKIVINEYYCPFALSEEGVKYYNSLSPIKLPTDDMLDWGGVKHINCDLCRDDPYLIKTITDLKEKAAPSGCKLKIVEIPDEYSYRIEDYDCWEHVVLLPREEEVRRLCSDPDALVEYLRRSGCFGLIEESDLSATSFIQAKNYTLELTFSPEANMDEMLSIIKDICQKAGCEIIKHEGNIIIYGANEYDQFGPAYIHLLNAQQIKPYLVKAIWSDKDACFHSCLENILQGV